MRHLVRKFMTCTLLLASAFVHTPTMAASAPVNVVELFTSQGCNSCPPADAVLTELAAQPGILALAFHVDYWDYLGWRDRFGLAISAERQQQYVQRLKLSGGFTPQLVINGQQSLVGSNRAGIEASLSRTHVDSTASISIHVQAKELLIEVQPAGTVAAQSAEVLLVPYLRHASSPIARGENRGRELSESNIVRSVRILSHWDGRTARYVVPRSSLPGDATDVAVLVQTEDQGAILAAAATSL